MKGTFILILTLLSVSARSQQGPVSAFLEKWENSKNYLLQIAESMPESEFDFKPTQREMSFGEQLLHIKQNMDWLGNSYFGAPKMDKPASALSKQQIIEAIKLSFDNVSTAVKNVDETDLTKEVDFFAGPKTKMQILNLLQDHVTHHRGQLIVYLNLCEIKPPKYIGW